MTFGSFAPLLVACSGREQLEEAERVTVVVALVDGMHPQVEARELRAPPSR